MKEVKSLQKTKRMRQARSNDEKMQQLMTGAKNIEALAEPFLRKLISALVHREMETGDSMTTHLYSISGSSSRIQA